MPSSYSASLRLTLQATGENNNTWGVILNQGAFQLVDSAIAGFAVIALTGAYALSSANGAADEARMAMMKFTGVGAFVVTAPAVSRVYRLWNAATGVLTFTNGSASVTLQPGETATVMTDGGATMKKLTPSDFSGVALTGVGGLAISAGGVVTLGGAPTADLQAATKKYVDDTAFNMAAGALPGQGGNAGKFLTTNGFTASWGALSVAGIADYAADQATRAAALQSAMQAQAIAFAVAL